MLTDKTTEEVIRNSRKKVTILFSDIQQSTRHWERRGDVDARLLIDRHNRLLFPVIRKFNGRVIKTLGDAIMASFSKPENAVRAAIAMQQVLNTERHKDKYFSLRIRIGIHTGTGIVESDDIYGDVVNIAAKTQAEAEASQILITQSTRAWLDKNEFKLVEYEDLKPMGKRKPIQLLECDWADHRKLIHQLQPVPLMPLMGKQKLEILSYLFVSLLSVYTMYEHYFRYLLMDLGLSLDLPTTLQSLPTDILMLGVFLTLLLGLAFIYLLRVDFISRSLLKILSGTFGFGILFISFHLINDSVRPPFHQGWYGSMFRSSHIFVRTISDNVNLYTEPGINAHVIRSLAKNDVFIYETTVKRDYRQWDKVRLGSDKSGLLPKRIPPAFGVAEEKLTLTQKFNFRYYDLYSIIISLFGFTWGLINFRIRPN